MPPLPTKTWAGVAGGTTKISGGLTPLAAFSTSAGRRPTQQDESLILDALFGSGQYKLYAVFDGHGNDGKKCADYAKQHIPEHLNNDRDHFMKDPIEALKAAFEATGRSLLEDSSIDTYMSGTTAVVAVLCVSERTVYIANVGDSRAVVGRDVEEGEGWKASQITRDHNCEVATERERVISKGGRVEALVFDDGSPPGPLRVFKGSLPYPGLVVTRSLGDAVAHKLGVISTPDVFKVSIAPSTRFLLIGSDGVFDGVSLPEVLSIVYSVCMRSGVSVQSAQQGSDAITKASLEGMDREQLDDNSTNVLVLFEQ
ncbi:protein serine/threonine phosphatase 2C [Gonapodya prolifera JEL478]|uniref:Protein serine/threonine phosphatase 2C n=1 Tax=Gonapodya prolifera (strain JEL478) TaxID=1344416 RepID=A0A139AM61_GONPJ|nr:protein serine/threonine phosphatase 2C [Gonapodya prolifera JEL478]|eukprot:KXS17788.1 protein serine/threonine phosphatase 2C [Gonapodya prolifera JEL478]